MNKLYLFVLPNELKKVFRLNNWVFMKKNKNFFVPVEKKFLWEFRRLSGPGHWSIDYWCKSFVCSKILWTVKNLFSVWYFYYTKHGSKWNTVNKTILFFAFLLWNKVSVLFNTSSSHAILIHQKNIFCMDNFQRLNIHQFYMPYYIFNHTY